MQSIYQEETKLGLGVEIMDVGGVKVCSCSSVTLNSLCTQSIAPPPPCPIEDLLIS